MDCIRIWWTSSPRSISSWGFLEGLSWSHLGLFGFKCSHLVSPGPAWIRLLSLGSLDLGSNWFRFVGLVSTSFTWCHLLSLGFVVCLLISLAVTWSHLLPPGCNRFHMVSLDPTRSHLVWIHLVQLGLTWSHLALLGLASPPHLLLINSPLLIKYGPDSQQIFTK